MLGARPPTSHHGLSSDCPAHDLDLELQALPKLVLTGQRLTTSLADQTDRIPLAGGVAFCAAEPPSCWTLLSLNQEVLAC